MNTTSFNLPKPWLISEKIIGIIITLWGMATLYSITHTVYNMLSTGAETGFLRPENISYVKLLGTYHLNFLLSIATLYAGFNLVFNSREAWFMCLVAAFMYTILLLTSAGGSSKGAHQIAVVHNYSYLIAAVIALAVFILLLQKPFRKKYQPKTREWIITIGIMLLLLLDNAIF